MAAMNGDAASTSSSSGVDWTEFCEQQALTLALECVSGFNKFIQENATLDESGIGRRYMRYFEQLFRHYFFQHIDTKHARLLEEEILEYEYCHATPNDQGDRPLVKMFEPYFPPKPQILRNGDHQLQNTASRPATMPSSMRNSSMKDITFDDCEHDYCEREQASKHKPFRLRKWSFRSFKGSVRGLFNKQNSDEVELASDSSMNYSRRRYLGLGGKDKLEKSKIRKMIVEVLKESVVHQLIGEDQTGKTHWEKTKLSLIKTTAGFMLEYYTPIKSLKPKGGVFCYLITEVRETTALEMPDREHSFVIRAENNVEYIFETPNVKELKSWLAVIKACIRPRTRVTCPPTVTGSPGAATMASKTQGALSVALPPKGAEMESAVLSSQNRLSQNSLSSSEHPPELPPRTPTRPLSSIMRTGSSAGLASTHRLSASPSSDAGSPRIGAGDHGITAGAEVNMDQLLRDYPWFHGTLSRMDAATFVLLQGVSGHGIFLIRQSETRKGEYVLTFNFQGRAKHLRMTINSEGQCRVQHLWFQTIFDMLEHFRTHPIPLESGGVSDVTLMDYVVAAERPRSPHSHNTGSTNSSGGESAVGTVWTVGGSVRMRTESLENMTREQAQALQGRAIENHYTFV
ncbi:SH2B adapter protein 2-like [Tubulanus polymorphus]|uniref:SH2B adapter protein 2-like n=1 Tax=Tubulanus polymorphus TaxID=672921 RepID=UPI003DA43B0E